MTTQLEEMFSAVESFTEAVLQKTGSLYFNKIHVFDFKKVSSYCLLANCADTNRSDVVFKNVTTVKDVLSSDGFFNGNPVNFCRYSIRGTSSYLSTLSILLQAGFTNGSFQTREPLDILTAYRHLLSMQVSSYDFKINESFLSLKTIIANYCSSESFRTSLLDQLSTIEDLGVPFLSSIDAFATNSPKIMVLVVKFPEKYAFRGRLPSNASYVLLQALSGNLLEELPNSFYLKGPARALALLADYCQVVPGDLYPAPQEFIQIVDAGTKADSILEVALSLFDPDTSGSLNLFSEAVLLAEKILN